MLTFITVGGILLAIVGAFIGGILFGRKNVKKVEKTVDAVKDPIKMVSNRF